MEDGVKNLFYSKNQINNTKEVGGKVMSMLIESKTGNILTSIAIGEQYYQRWYTYAYPSWKRYCEKYGIGLFILKDFASKKEDGYRKHVMWEKYLTFSEIKKCDSKIKNVCYIDTDFLISPIAANVFDDYKDNSKIAMVSQYRNMPYDYMEVRRRIAFFRHNCYDKKYPLDSSMFMSIKDMCDYHGVQEMFDFGCAGFFMGSIEKHADFFKNFFYSYTEGVQSIDGTEEFHLNYLVQTSAEIQWLPYPFQALWTHEMAWKYPFLYDYGRDNKELIKQCIETSLIENHFLHFAGSWHESKMFTDVHVFDNPETLERITEYEKYRAQPLTGKPVGIIHPNE